MHEQLQGEQRDPAALPGQQAAVLSRQVQQMLQAQRQQACAGCLSEVLRTRVSSRRTHQCAAAPL